MFCRLELRLCRRTASRILVWEGPQLSRPTTCFRLARHLPSRLERCFNVGNTAHTKECDIVTQADYADEHQNVDDLKSPASFQVSQQQARSLSVAFLMCAIASAWQIRVQQRQNLLALSRLAASNFSPSMPFLLTACRYRQDEWPHAMGTKPALQGEAISPTKRGGRRLNRLHGHLPHLLAVPEGHEVISEEYCMLLRAVGDRFSDATEGSVAALCGSGVDLL